ncbi:MAG: disulfide bond formation protein DsbA, partial [Proteobacteria bacterium]|nr:disulfide bond formation protein DsbA [Pseudomonadota bacterium]
DNVRRALTAGALRDGHRIGEMDISVEIASSASGIDRERLRERATHPTTEARVRASTDAFHATGATQRPTFVVTSKIGDLAVMSGFYRSAPLSEAIRAMLSDARAYRDYGVVHGDPPAV